MIQKKTNERIKKIKKKVISSQNALFEIIHHILNINKQYHTEMLKTHMQSTTKLSTV